MPKRQPEKRNTGKAKTQGNHMKTYGMEKTVVCPIFPLTKGDQGKSNRIRCQEN
jgi:hypothetical protein